MTEVTHDGAIATGLRFENSYSKLPDRFHAPSAPARFRAPRVSVLNHRLAEQLGLDLTVLSPEAAANLFTGQYLPRGSVPISQAYAGHQYGGFTMLGDGRAILLGEHRTPSGQLVDLQLKGAGPTQYSRRGDGLAALGPMLREYIISEAMAALGIPTTRSLAVVTTGETVFRTTGLKGAVLTRIAASHLRVGTFEYAAACQDVDNLRILADYAIQRHAPELANQSQKYLDFFRTVLDRQAALIAHWQLVGFVHGVMNTDNMTISGETIDYGPCAFMNAYDPKTVFSSIDHAGRYAFGNQPAIAHWNLARFGESLLPLLHQDPEQAVAVAVEVLNEFPSRYQGYWLSGMRRKLGFQSDCTEDPEIIHDLINWMQKTRADYTNTFRDLSQNGPPADEVYQDPEFQAWYARWQWRLNEDNQGSLASEMLMQSVNPVVIPRNHRVEEALTAAEESDDLKLLESLLAVLSNPFRAGPETAKYRMPPEDDEHYRTFCGT